MASKRRRTLSVVISIVVAAVCVASGWWAGSATMVNPSPPKAESEPITVEVVEMTIGRALSFNVTVNQPFEVVGFNSAAGTVTNMSTAGTVATGDVLYSIDEQPVVAVGGSVPFYRSLHFGDEGSDVEQLRRMLISGKHMSGQATGSYDWQVAAAVQHWQKSLGQPTTGEIALGDLMAIPDLPASINFDKQLVVGAKLVGGESVIRARTGEILFTIVLNSDQASLIPADAVVTVKFDESTWSAAISTRSIDENGSILLELVSPDGGSVCGEECSDLPPDEEISLLAEVTLVPPVTGAAIPVAAIRGDAERASYVVTESGSTLDVEVLESDGGIAVVTGVEVGTTVVIFGEANGVRSPAIPTSPPSPSTQN